MKLSSVGQNYVNSRIQNYPTQDNNSKVSIPLNDQQGDAFQPSENNKKNKKKIFKIGAMVAGAGALLASLTACIFRGKKIHKLQDALETCQKPFKDEIAELGEKVAKQTSELANLEKENKGLQQINATLEENARKAQEALNEVLNENDSAKASEEIYSGLKTKINTSDIGYDIMTPPVTGKKLSGAANPGAIDLPEVTKPVSSSVKALDIPSIGNDGSFDFSVPRSDKIKISKAGSTWQGEDAIDQATTVSRKYSDSVNWDNAKISRDILQNFYDGHGQTLDGVRLHFEPIQADGITKYRVRIEGDSTYTPDKALFLGGTTKQDDVHAAGNYGEGIKMVALKLLSSKGAKNVEIGSDGWKLTYKLGKSNIADESVMCYDLVKTPSKAGNYVEFETDDRSLLEELRGSIDKFYHSGNKHFEAPDFENDKIGIKVLKQPTQFFEGESGGVYIAGQRFEFDDSYEGLKGGVLFLKEKPPKKVIDISRDRTSLDSSDMYRIGLWLAEELKPDEKVKLLNALRPVWGVEHKNTALGELLEAMLSRQSSINHYDMLHPGKELYINFPTDKFVAYSQASKEVVQDLYNKGYTVCNEEFSKIGMQTIRELIGDARKHTPVKPTDDQLKKIAIIKEALKKLSPELIDKHFTKEELDTKIFIFDRQAANEARMYSNTNAEAIIDYDTSKGFWIDKTYLDKSDFSDVLETALHELSHKAGGDETMEFSYKLTNVNQSVLNELIKNPKTKSELTALSRLWEEVKGQKINE